MQPGTEAPVAVFDLDGVIVRTPVKHTVSERSYWHDLWMDVDGAEPNPEIIELITALVCAGTHVVVLTARPSCYRVPTERVIERCLRMPVVGLSLVGSEEAMLWAVGLVMDENTGETVGVGSGEWKRSVIQGWIDAGVQVRFMAEDYKPSADVIRQAVPVLLYESHRP